MNDPIVGDGINDAIVGGRCEYLQSPQELSEDFIYNNCEKTRNAEREHGYIKFTKHFNCLGSFISYNLKDDY